MIFNTSEMTECQELFRGAWRGSRLSGSSSLFGLSSSANTRDKTYPRTRKTVLGCRSMPDEGMDEPDLNK